MSFWLACISAALAAPLLEYDPGTARVVGSDRAFRDAEVCVAEHPCTLNQFGAIRPHTDGGADRLEIWASQGTETRQVLLFHHTADEARGAFWKITHQSRNDAVLNFDTMFEQAGASPPVIYIYGINLQYPLANGDLLMVEVQRPGEEHPHRYYFRNWQAGYHVGWAVTTLFPITPLATNGLGRRIENSSINLAFSLLLYKNLDPDGDARLPRVFWNGLQPTLLVGFLSELGIEGGALVKHTDAFVGGGVTFLRCLHVGGAVSLIRQPRGVFPYAALHLDQLLRVIEDVSATPTRRWEKYRESEASDVPD